MYLAQLSLFAISFLAAAQTVFTKPAVKCIDGYYDFTKSLGTPPKSFFQVESKKMKLTEKGIKMTLEKPKQFIRLKDANYDDKPYNKYGSPYAVNFGSHFVMKYGKVTFDMKVSDVPGVVTAAMLFTGVGGDEIDFEMLGAEPNRVQTNFYYGSKPEYGINMGDHKVKSDLSAGFHKYTIDWSSERIKFSVDGHVVRTVYKEGRCDGSVCKYPTSYLPIRFSLWDSSSSASTTEWAKGPVDWNKEKTPTTYVRSIKVECDPDYQ